MNYIVFKSNGVEYKLGKADARIMQEFCDWAKDRLPDPFERFKKSIEGMPEKYADKLFEEAKKQAAIRGTLQDPALLNLMKTPDGVFKFYHLRLNAYQPNLSQEEANNIILAYMQEVGEKKFKATMQLAEKLDGKVALSEEQAEAAYFRGQGLAASEQ
jgi:hypothetical protein